MVIIYQQINIHFLPKCKKSENGGNCIHTHPLQSFSFQLQHTLQFSLQSLVLIIILQQSNLLFRGREMSTVKQDKPTAIEQIYNEHDFIDAKDNQGDWRVGYIVGKYQLTKVFKVRFDGWPSKYDENYKFNSPKLKPFRSVVVGYTGQQQNPGIREWKFIQAQHQEKTNLIQSFFAHPQKCSVHDMNQLLRGHNYLYVDFLMTWKYQTLEGITAAIEYFLINIKFLATFLHQINEHFQEFLKTIDGQRDINTQTNLEAYYLAYYEIFDAGYIISGNYPRLNSFFKDNGDRIKEYFQDFSRKQAKKVYQIQIISQFIKLKGLEAIIQIIDKLLVYEELIPFLFLQSLTNLFNGLSSLIGTADRELVIEKLIKIGEANLKKVKDHHFKDFHKHHVSNFLSAVINSTFNTSYHQNILLWSIELELQLSLKMIACPYFESKLKGITHINKICEKNDFILKNEWFKQWLNKTKLIESLFLNNDNQQFIKKACELVKYLNIKNNITDEDIDLIWKSRLGKHETTVKEIYTLVSELPMYETEYEDKLVLFNKISNIPSELWDEDYIKMIKDFSENSYGIDVRQKLVEPFGFDIVYEYTKKTESQFSLGLITTLLQKVEKSKIFNPFQQRCFESIQNNSQPQLNIKLLLIICNNRLDSFDKLSINMISILITFLIYNSKTQNFKIINDSLELLGQVVRSTSKEIQIQELMQLWHHFINSNHKDSFMKWLYRKKETGRVIVNQALNETHRSYLLNHLWNKQEQIRAISENEALFLIELLKSVNTSNTKMKRVNITIRPLSLELDGYDKLWNILKYSENEKVIELICDFIAEINTSYEDEQLKLSIENLVENIAIQIKASLQIQNISYISKLLLLTEKLIFRDEEVYNYQYTPKINYLRQFTVIHKEKKQEKVHKFNCMAVFYDFKKMVSQKWGIALHKLKIYNNKHELIKIQNYFKSMNENQYINYKFQIQEIEEEESFIKECLNKELDLFFILLDDKRIEKSVWSIVEKLPISDELKFKIIQTQDILGELEKVGFYKELYELKVILELSQEWWEKFITTSNLNLLIKNLNKTNFSTHIQLEYLTTLTTIISKMLNLNYRNDLELEIPIILIKNILTLLKDFLKNVHLEGSQNLNLELKLIRNLFDIGESLKISLDEDDFLAELLYNQQNQDIFVSGLITISQIQIRKKFSEHLRNLISDCKSQHWISILNLLLIKLLQIVVIFNKKENLKEYFDFTSNFLDKVPEKYLSNFIESNGKMLCNKIFDLAKNESNESLNGSPNIALIGYLSLLRHLTPYQISSIQNSIGTFVLFDCLFSNSDCKCKSKKSRWEALNLLRSLFVNPKIVDNACSYLVELHKKGKWRTRRIDDWVITLLDKMKSSTGYVGLKNLGCICYMNSFMQQLYMIPNFQRSIVSCQDPYLNQQDTEENLLYQIQKMFLSLQNSEKKFYNPKQFCHAFKDYDGNPTNVSQQMDIDQFSNILFDRIQNQLKQTKQETLIKDMFGGVYSNQIVCKGCPHFSETEEHFLSISLTVKGKKNIYQSFDTMIKGDTLDGDNAYFCERCNKKVSAVKRVSLKQLPNYLIVTLKRFEFDYEKMIKLKVNDYCEFPHNLNLREYSRQYLRKKQNPKIVQDEQDESNDYYNYILKGVVVHVGYADSGHYYSFIQDRNTMKWCQFNDTVVRDFNIEDLPEQAFGGEYGGYEAKQKIKNAYMLLYEREKKRNVEKEFQIKQEEITQNPIYNGIIEEITAENKEFKIQNILFSAEYNRFINQILENLQDYDENIQKTALKYSITTYLTITVREKSDSEIYNKLKRINSQLQRHPEIKEWILSTFSQNLIFQEFFKNNMIRQVKKLLAYWLVDLYKGCNRDSQQYFCNLILNKLVEDNDNVLEYCIILYEISKHSSKTLDYLVKHNIIGRYIENIIRKDPRLFVQKLQILHECESEIGNEITIQRTNQQKNIKKLRLENENGYVWALINLIIARSKELNIDLDKYITKAESQYLWLPQAKIYKILQEIRNKFQMYEFLNFITYLTVSNKQFLATIISTIYNGLKDFQSKRYRQFFLLFEKVINVQDQYRPIRVGCFRKIIDALHHNEQYSLDSNIIQQWIVILINRNQNLRTFVASEEELIQYLLKLPSKKLPSEQIARKNSVFGEFMINKYHGVKFPKNKKGYSKICDDMTDFYQQIIDKKFTQSSQWPSIFQTESKELKVGETIAYFDTKDKIDYQQAKIESIFLGRIELHQKRNRVTFAWKDDEKITFDTKFVVSEEQNELNSSRTTQMDIDQDEQLFEDL